MENMRQLLHLKIIVNSFVFLLQHILLGSAGREGRNGYWQLLLNNTGVVAMHMALTHRNTVIMYDQTRSGRSGYPLKRRKNGSRCVHGEREDQVDSSCYAHSVEYRVSNNRIRPLRLETDTWCSSGSFLSNGTLAQTGGYDLGARRTRYFTPCEHSECDWNESVRLLSDKRWYSSNQILPDDRIIVVGGRRVFTYEFVPKLSSEERSFNLPFLHRTNDGKGGENNLYPFLHLSPDGNLFIFANRDSILFDYKHNRVVKKFPKIPDDGSRNYPSTGSSVILPLDHTDNFKRVEVMVCGGSASGAHRAAKRGKFLKALSSCGRMVITGDEHKWEMENMPGPRLLNDMIILSTGDVLIINGAKHGSAGWNNAENPSLEPYLYEPNKKLGERFSVLQSTSIARMYHSSAVLLPDGRVLVAGSNPNKRYTFKDVAYPTELRLEAFVPPYMESKFNNRRPGNVSIYYGNGINIIGHGEQFIVQFWLARKPSKDVGFSIYAPPFATHSVSMNQRMLRLRCIEIHRDKDGWVNAVLEAPPSHVVAPSGYYLLTVVNGGIPSTFHWIRLVNSLVA